MVKLYHVAHTALLTAAQYETFNAVMPQSLRKAVGQLAVRTAATHAACRVVMRAVVGQDDVVYFTLVDGKIYAYKLDCPQLKGRPGF